MGTLVWKPAPYADTQVLTVSGSRTYTIEAGVPAEILPEDIAAVTTALKATQGLLATAGQPTVATNGAAGSTACGWKVVAVGQSGDGVPSTERTLGTCNATIDGTNSVTITKGTLPATATGWKVLRTTAGGTPSSTGLISGVLPTTTASFIDTGTAASVYVPIVTNPAISLVVSGPSDA